MAIDLETENETLRRLLAEFEASASSAREIARFAMGKAGTYCVRAEITRTAESVSVIVCAPDGDEEKAARAVAAHMQSALRELGWIATGEVAATGSTK